MVAAHHIHQDRGGLYFFGNAVADQKIVDTPAGVLLPGLKPVRPPGINSRLIRIEIPPGIGKTGCQQLRELFSLLIRETGIIAVCLWILPQVDKGARLELSFRWVKVLVWEKVVP